MHPGCFDRWSALLSVGLVASCLLGCSDAEAVGGPVEALYVVPDSLTELDQAHFYDHPWPSEIRTEDGYPLWEGFPNPYSLLLIDEYLDAADGLIQGFSPVGAGYLRFTGPIDWSSLPATPLAATSPTASVQLIDIDSASPEQGTRQLVSLSHWEPEGVYLRANTLEFMPTLGFPLRHGTRYALVVTRQLRAADGAAVSPSAHLEQVLGLQPADGARAAARAELADAVSALGDAGIGTEQIAHLAVFRTSDPTAEMQAVTDHVHSSVAAPDFDPARWEPVDESSSDYDEYRGWYGPSPNYQVGTAPYRQYGDGGQFNFVDGSPEVVDTFDLRFSLTVPKAASCPMPQDGYPIVLYAHGTGGSYLSHRGFARTLAGKCLASMGVDQILHGERPGAPDDPAQIGLLFFNFQNVIAGRTNTQQSAIDEVQRARLFTEAGAVIPAAVAATGQDIHFDGTRVLFMGHSQGGLNGPLYLAVDDSARGGVLSGSGSVIGIALLFKTEPPPAIPALVKTLLLGLSAEEEGEVDLFHPAITLAQSLIDPIDAVNYARLTVREPLPGLRAKSVYMSEGIGPDGVGDSYAPPKGTEAQAIAMGLPLQLPGQYPIEELQWGGPEPVSVPAEGLAGNLAAGDASGVLAQWAPPPGEDGHFVIFDVPEAREQAAEFLRQLADDPAGRVPAP